MPLHTRQSCCCWCYDLVCCLTDSFLPFCLKYWLFRIYVLQISFNYCYYSQMMVSLHLLLVLEICYILFLYCTFFLILDPPSFPQECFYVVSIFVHNVFRLFFWVNVFTLGWYICMRSLLIHFSLVFFVGLGKLNKWPTNKLC